MDIIKEIIKNAVTDYVKDLTSGTKKSYKMMTPDEKEMFVRDTEEDLDDTIEDLLSDFNPKQCMRMYSSYEVYQYFMRYKCLYWNYTKSVFEDTYREMINKMIEE